MERQTWKEYKCKIGQGKACCRHLVRYGEVYLCNKRSTSLPSIFKPFPDAEGDGGDCPGTQDLMGVEKNNQKSYDTYDRVSVSKP